MNKTLLADHVKNVCQLNLRLYRVVRCAACPFEPEIVEAYPNLRYWFDSKRQDAELRRKGRGKGKA